MGMDTIAIAPADIIDELVGFAIPREAFAPTVCWFDCEPPVDRRSASLQPAPSALVVLQANLYHRERRRRQRIEVTSCVMKHANLLVYLRRGDQQHKRAYAAHRGSFHVALMSWRYDSVAQTGDLSQTCTEMVELLALASRQVTSLSHVADEVDRLDRKSVV